MPRPLAAWMNGQRYGNGGAVSYARKNTLILPCNTTFDVVVIAKADVFTMSL
jgi:hypothetical protein